MKKPTPPSSPSSLFPEPQGFSSVNTRSRLDNMQPISPPSNLENLLDEEQNQLYLDDYVIEHRDSGVGTTIEIEESKILCNRCVNYWKLHTLAPVKNLKPDGSHYTKKEEYCIFSDKLFTLSDRGAVLECTRFTEKK